MKHVNIIEIRSRRFILESLHLKKISMTILPLIRLGGKKLFIFSRLKMYEGKKNSKSCLSFPDSICPSIMSMDSNAYRDSFRE
jgi:hypothetical protein